MKSCKKLSVIKLNQFFGGKVVFRIIDTSKKGVEMHRIKDEFDSRKDANKYIKEHC